MPLLILFLLFAASYWTNEWTCAEHGNCDVDFHAIQIQRGNSRNINLPPYWGGRWTAPSNTWPQAKICAFVREQRTLIGMKVPKGISTSWRILRGGGESSKAFHFKRTNIRHIKFLSTNQHLSPGGRLAKIEKKMTKWTPIQHTCTQILKRWTKNPKIIRMSDHRLCKTMDTTTLYDRVHSARSVRVFWQNLVYG